MNAIRKIAIAAASAAALLVSTSAFATYNVDFLVENYSGYDIIGVWAVTSGSSTWGPNLLRGNIIDGYYGDSLWLAPARPQGYCVFDIVLMYEDGVEDVLRNVNLCVEYTVVADVYETYVY